VTQYLDSSVLLAVLLAEAHAQRVRDLLLFDPDWLTARHTFVEVRRRLARLVSADSIESARRDFARYWERTTVVELDVETCTLAALIAERTGARTLDALHLAAAQRASGTEATVLSLDRRMLEAARSLGMPTRGLDIADP
jgi:uncharacterized protein